MNVKPRNRKKWALAALTLVTAATLIAAGVTLGACSGSSAARAAKASDNTASRVGSVIKLLDTVDTAQFKFPAAFGEEFESLASPVNANTSLNRPKKYNAYINSMDNLYGTCAEISAMNAQIKQCITEIEHANNETKKLAGQLKNSNTAAANCAAIERQNADTRRDLGRLYKDRGKLVKSTKKIPDTGNNINVDVMTERYSELKNKLEQRLDLLTAVKERIQDVNSTMHTVMQPSFQDTSYSMITRPNAPRGNEQQEHRRPRRIYLR